MIVSIDIDLRNADWPKRTDDRMLSGSLDEFCVHGALTAACTSASCRPPTSGGTGGSISRGSLRRTPLDPANAELQRGVGAALKRRIERDLKEEHGPMYVAVWKQGRKAALDDDERRLLALKDGDPEAIAALVQHKVDPSRFKPSTDEGLLSAVDEALVSLDQNKPFKDAVAKFGAVPVVVAESIGGGASGRDLTDAVVLSEMAGTKMSAPIGELVTDGSLPGTIRHEYGHHIESIAPSELVAPFYKAHAEWPGRLGGPADVDRVVDAGAVDGKFPTHGVSVYARTNGKEAFAEVFALVTHPDFDRSRVSSEALPMVDAMLEILK